MKNKYILVVMFCLLLPGSVFAEQMTESLNHDSQQNLLELKYSNNKLLAAAPRLNKEPLTNLEKAALLKQEIVSSEKINIAGSDSKKIGFSQVLSDYWVSLLALLVSVIGLILGVTGFSMATKKKQKNLKKFFHEIDDAFSCYKMKGKRCEAELYRLQNEIEEQLKEGKIDESTFHLLEGRIKKYLEKISPQD